MAYEQPLASARRAGAGSTTPAATPRAARSSTTTSPLLAETDAGLPQPHPARAAWRSSRATTTSPGSTGSCSSSTTRASSPPPAASAGTCCSRCCRATRRARSRRPAGCRTSSGATTSSSSCRTTASPSSAAPTRSCSRSPARSARRCSPPTTATTPTATTHEAHDALLCVQTGALDERPEALQVRRRRALPEDGGTRCATCSASCPRRATTRCGSPSGPTSRSSSASRSCPTSRSPRASPTTPTTSRHLTLRGRQASAGATTLPDDVRRAPRLRARGHRRHGLLRRTSSSSGTSSSTPRDARHPRRPGPGLAPPGARVAYCLRITDLDPIKYDLLFERFLNPSRMLDARHRHGLRLPLPRRDDPLRGRALRPRPRRPDRHVLHDQGPGRGARRGAGARLPVRASATRSPRRCRRWSWAATRRCSACFEQHPKYDDGYKMAAELRAMYDADPDVKRVVDVAKGLEGLRRQDGIHAAAVVITKEPLTEYLPIQRKPEAGRDARGRADRHPVRDARRRGARPAEDGLPRPAQPRRHRPTRVELIERPRGIRLRHRRRRRSTTSRRSSCCGRATRSACSSSRAAPMRALLRSLAPTSSTTSPRSSRCTGPGPMAPNMHNDYADRKNGRKPVDVLPPRRRGDARRHLRADDLPGAA